MLTLLGLALALGTVAILIYAAFKLKLRTLAASTLAAWLAYGTYESLMQARILCSGDCNVRVDLLLIYPVLLVLTACTIVRAVTRRAGSRQS